MKKNTPFDVIVCGLGANGAAALYFLSKMSNLKILGIEAKKPAHQESGSFGQTRLLRRSYFENPDYVPLVTQSLEFWNLLQKTCSHTLIKKTGLIFLGPKENPIFDQIYKCSKKYTLKIDAWSIEHARRRFPFLKIPEGFKILFEKEACVLFPEVIISHLVREATKNKSVKVSLDEPVLKIKTHANHIVVTTAQGNYTTQKLLMTVGGWTKALLPELSLPIEIRESPQFWFQEKGNTPVSVPFAFPLSDDFIYGFPDFGMGVKMASYHPGRKLKTPEQRTPQSTHGLKSVQQCIKNHFPYVSKKPHYQHTCFFDLGPGDNLILDFYPKNKQIVFIAAGSGHGLKMAPTLAKSAIDMLITEKYVSQTMFLKLKNEGKKSLHPRKKD